ncbi:tyrosine-protein phosphatase 69D-like, partial [Pollicipes pollicipes]|uniref:tyrosine-protein phosphatase 69D-like n=1 Tax=Pollicipes pollicipes TaxID=41117 RepID=UPI0018851406
MAPPIAPWYGWLLPAVLLSSVSCLKAGAAEIIKVTEPGRVDSCENVTISCTARPVDATVWWTRDGANVSLSQRVVVERETKDKTVVSHLTVGCVSLPDQGNYTCHVSGGKLRTVLLDVRAAPELVSSGGATARVGDPVTVSCSFRASPPPTIGWTAGKRPIKDTTPRHQLSVRNVSSTELESLLTITNVSAKDGGELTCAASNDAGRAEHTVLVTVQRRPEVKIIKAVAVGMSHIFINWTVNNGNAPIQSYRLRYMEVGTDQWVYHSVPVPANATSFVVDSLKPNRGYRVQLTAVNAVGSSEAAERGQDGRLITQERDPTYKPVLSVKAATTESLTLSWSQPSPDVAPFIQSYRLMRTDGEDRSNVEELVVFHPTTLFLWPDLRAGRTYNISVRACNDLVPLCGPWSDDVSGVTMVDTQVKPRDVLLKCSLDQAGTRASIVVAWQPPVNAAGVRQYTVTVTGKSEYFDTDGSRVQMLSDPDMRSVPALEQTVTFKGAVPNTNYTVHVCAGAADRCSGGGGAASRQCAVGAGLPAASQLQQYRWWRVRRDERWLIQLQVDRVLERNGPICCYRVVMVQLRPDQQLASLPHPSKLPIKSYEDVQAEGAGAYLADAFEHDFVKTRYVTLGDDQVTDETACQHCVPPAGRHRRRQTAAAPAPLAPRDGPLLEAANYTAFIQLVVRRGDSRRLAMAHTDYVSPPISPKPPAQQERTLLGVVIGVACALALCVLVLLVTLLALKRYGKDVAVSRALRDMLGSMRGQTVADSPVPDLPPIARHDLVAAYQERHRDSDLGFRREFEALPQRLHDRTTYASEALENFKKNRYPDIRAYDQTRVKLSQIDGIQSTEYINANFVWGYKERKKFICAQGPLEATIVDFWRMVWEHCCELMIMLTNLEEVGRTKCAKYWPEEGETTYGAITVSLAEEKPYSDYIQRVLSISRPRPDGSVETRRITHLHYLVWKDFMAPEYPTGILRFIKRVNELYLLEMGPILVHCSDFVKTRYVTLGDDQVTDETACQHCVPPAGRHRRRQTAAAPAPLAPRDGPLLEAANYTAFIQLVVRRGDSRRLAMAHTDYVSPPISPKPPAQQERTLLGVVIGVACALALCVLVLL